MAPEPRRRTSTLADPVAEARFVADGFVVVEVAEAPVIERLRAAVVDGPDGEAMSFSDHELTSLERQRFFDAVTPVMGPIVADLFHGHRIVSASHVRKPPGSASAMDWHVDPAVTDERVWTSASIWIPLDDVDDENGTLEVMRRGQRGTPPDRGGRTSLAETWPPPERVLAGCREAGGAPSGPLRVRRGHAVVYDHRLPHRSGQNRRSIDRVAVNIGVLPTLAPLTLFEWRSDDAASAIRLSEGALVVAPLDRPFADWTAAMTVGTLGGPVD